MKRVYFSGLGVECRKLVMEFNMQRGDLEEIKVGGGATVVS